MTWTHVIEHIIILISSFVAGIIIYFMMSKAHIKDKKERINWLVSIVIQLVIYLWIAKGIVLFPRLIKDPMAVLAYPSNAWMLSIALLFLAVHVAVHIKKNVIPVRHMIEVFVPVLISTQFVYVCIQLLQTNRTSYLIHASILFVLILLYIAVKNIHTPTGYMMLLFGWATGSIILSLLFSRLVLFGYTVSPILYVVLMALAGWTGWKMKFEREF